MGREMYTGRIVKLGHDAGCEGELGSRCVVSERLRMCVEEGGGELLAVRGSIQ